MIEITRMSSKGQIVIPQEAPNGLLRVKTNEYCGNQISNSYLFGLFDKPEEPLVIIQAPPNHVEAGFLLEHGAYFWVKRAMVGNFDRVYFKIYREEEIVYECKNQDCYDPNTTTYSFNDILRLCKVRPLSMRSIVLLSQS